LQINKRAVISVFLLTFAFTLGISVASKSILQYIGLGSALFALFVIITLGIIFDIIGTAAAASVEEPFNAMAANKVFGASTALKLVRIADRVASFCNDVIGDICGTVSGSLMITVLFRFLQEYPKYSSKESLLSVIGIGLVAAMTVAGKALGKGFAIHQSTSIILFVGRIFASIEKFTGLTVPFGENTKNDKSRKNLRH
jgi:CBS domain containing-hemolysin-like protein